MGERRPTTKSASDDDTLEAPAALSADPARSRRIRRARRIVFAALFLPGWVWMSAGYRGRVDTEASVVAYVGRHETSIVEEPAYDEAYVEYGAPNVFLTVHGTKKAESNGETDKANRSARPMRGTEFNLGALLLNGLIAAVVAAICAGLFSHFHAAQTDDPPRIPIFAGFCLAAVFGWMLMHWKEQETREAKLLDAHKYFAYARQKMNAAVLEPQFPTIVRKLVGDENLLMLRFNRLSRTAIGGPAVAGDHLALDVAQLTGGSRRTDESPYFSGPAEAFRFLLDEQPEHVCLDVSTRDAEALKELRTAERVRRVLVRVYHSDVLAAVSELPNLRRLSIIVRDQYPSSADADPRPLARLETLEDLAIHYEAAPGRSPADFFVGLPNLRRLKVRRVSPGVAPPRFEWSRWRAMPLESLVIDVDFLEAREAVAALAAMPNLRRLELREISLEPDRSAWETRRAELAAALPGVEVVVRTVDRIEHMELRNRLSE